MPSIQRPLAGDVLVFEIDEERERAVDIELIDRSGRNARTLVRMGPLRVTLVVLGPGGELAEHEAAGPITVQVVQGRISFMIEGQQHNLGPGQLLVAGPGVRHSVASREGAAFLLTVSHVGRNGEHDVVNPG
jgi:quercetin dioxygenase-like cupin family protein